MDHLLDSIEASLRNENWYAALMLTLSLPDICANADGISGMPAERYKQWAKEWVEPFYTRMYPDDSDVQRALAEIRNAPFAQGMQLAGKLIEARREASEKLIPEVIITAGHLYGFRCAFSHQGSFDTKAHRSANGLDGFKVITPPKNGSVHLNRFGNTTQIQIDLFCREICERVSVWLKAKETNAEVQESLRNLPRIVSIW